MEQRENHRRSSSGAELIPSTSSNGSSGSDSGVGKVRKSNSGGSTPLPPFKNTFLPNADQMIKSDQMAAKFTTNSWQFCSFLGTFQAIFVIFFACFVEYEDRWHKDLLQAKTEAERQAIIKAADAEMTRNFAWFQDVHVMIVAGIGFLMTFLKRYSWSSLGFNFIFAAFTVQWSILIQGFFFDSGHGVHGSHAVHENLTEVVEHKSQFTFIHINLMALMEAEFSAGAALISYGCVLGVASPVQCLIMIIFEMVFYKLNAYICFNIFTISDIGGSIVLHAFGAYFGLAVARCLFKKGQTEHSSEGTEYHSDIFSLCGTVFLWCFWPSFNSAPGGADDTGRYFAVVNTYLALCAAVMATYATSIWVTPGRKITMEHVQNATLAGGVAMGSAASMPVQPFAALLIGSIAGIVSVLGYSFVKPALHRAINLHDTCGVHNLHGMPSLIAAFASIIACASGYHNEHFATGRDQALYQLLALCVTLGISIVGGAITGFILNIPIWETLDGVDYFEDGKYWEMEVYQVVQEESSDEEKN